MEQHWRSLLKHPQVGAPPAIKCSMLAKYYTRGSDNPLCVIAGVIHMTEEEEFIAVQHEAEAVAEQAIHSSQKATDTPARNTRARNRLLALPVPLAAGWILLQCCI